MQRNLPLLVIATITLVVICIASKVIAQRQVIGRVCSHECVPDYYINPVWSNCGVPPECPGICIWREEWGGRCELVEISSLGCELFVIDGPVNFYRSGCIHIEPPEEPPVIVSETEIGYCDCGGEVTRIGSGLLPIILCDEFRCSQYAKLCEESEDRDG